MNVDVEIDQLECQLIVNPDNLDLVIQLLNKCIKFDKKLKCVTYIREVGPQILEKVNYAHQSSLSFIDCCLSYWKHERYSNKETMRLNASNERSLLLQNLEAILLKVAQNTNVINGQLISLRLAYVKESSGHLQESLVMLSEIISREVSIISFLQF